MSGLRLRPVVIGLAQAGSTEDHEAYARLQGVAAICLYDNLKVVVLQHDEDGPLCNPRFLAFATHNGFKPWACLPRRARTKGRVVEQRDRLPKRRREAARGPRPTEPRAETPRGDGKERLTTQAPPARGGRLGIAS